MISYIGHFIINKKHGSHFTKSGELNPWIEKQMQKALSSTNLPLLCSYKILCHVGGFVPSTWLEVP